MILAYIYSVISAMGKGQRKLRSKVEVKRGIWSW